MKNKINRRDVLKGTTALALGTVFASRVLAQAPPAEAITPQLIEAAKKEGKVVWYTSIDLSVSEKVGAAFKAKFGIDVRAERTGAERVFQRIGQEYASNVHAVDVANSSDAAHLLAWKRQGILLPYVPEDVAKYYKPEHRDADGTYAGFRATLSPIAYNTKLVKAEDAPASFKDLLDPKWKGKIVKAHPGYSGTILTATFEMVRDIGWDYYEALAKQNVMQVQSATDPPKKLSLGERSVMADGTEYNIFLLKESGQPVEAVYPTEGTPFIVGPNGIFKDGAQSQCGKAVPELLLHAGSAADHHRIRRPAFAAPAGQGTFRAQAARRHQADEGRRRRRREGERRDQGALSETVPCLSRHCERSEAIQSRARGVLDCFVASLLAMTKRRPTRCERNCPGAISSRARRRLGLSAWATRVMAAAPAPVSITPDLVEAAKKEGKVILYSSMDLPVGEKLGKAFEAQYPGIAVQIERSGSERLFQRVDQEFASNIRAVDVINTSDASHIITWKKNGWLAPFVTDDIAQHFLPEFRDPDGMSATSRIYLSSIAYNTKLVKPEDAPKSWADLLDPKWAGKMVKGHPAYSGTIMTATFQLVRELGWEYLEKLSKQRVMQVQSSTDPPKKLALGERAVMADGNEYGVVLLKEAGQPVEPVYPTEGTPTISGPTAIFATAPHPNAARLFQAWLHTRETQQFFADYTAQYSAHAQVQSKPGRRKISDLKLMKEDAAGVEAAAEEIKTRYAKLFRV